MPYTPNNPLIPGDPYSYDLRWIVDKIKELDAFIKSFPVDEIRRIVEEALAEGILEATYNGTDTIEISPGAGVNNGDIVKYFQIATDIINIRDAESFEMAGQALAASGEFSVLPQARIYDDAGAPGSWQGSCSDGNLTYVFNTDPNTFPNGKINVYNIQNHTLVNTFNTVKGYHGNDMCLRDSNHILIAQCYGDYNGNTSSKGFTQYNISTGASSEYFPFQDIGTGGMWGITNIDSNEIIVAIGSNSFWKYSLLTGEITALTVSGTIPAYNAAQTIEYNDGYLYALVTGPDAIIKMKLEGTVLTIEKIIELPKFDGNEVKIGEWESFKISNTPNKGDAVLTSISQDYYGAPAYTLHIYHVNLEKGNARYHIPYNYHYPQVMERDVHVDSTYTGLYENGSDTYPHKTLGRGLCASNRIQPNYTIVAAGSYTMPFIYNMHNIKLRSDGRITFTGGVNIQNSSIMFWGTNGVTINGNLNGYNSDLLMQDNIILNGRVNLNRGNYKILGYAQDDSSLSAITAAISLQACTAQLNPASDPVTNDTYWVMVSGNAILWYGGNIGSHLSRPGSNWSVFPMGVLFNHN